MKAEQGEERVVKWASNEVKHAFRPRYNVAPKSRSVVVREEHKDKQGTGNYTIDLVSRSKVLSKGECGLTLKQSSNYSYNGVSSLATQRSRRATSCRPSTPRARSCSRAKDCGGPSEEGGDVS